MQAAVGGSGIRCDKHAIFSSEAGPEDLKLNTLSLTWIFKSHLAEVYEKLMPLQMNQTQRETWQKPGLSTCQQPLWHEEGKRC